MNIDKVADKMAAVLGVEPENVVIERKAECVVLTMRQANELAERLRPRECSRCRAGVGYWQFCTTKSCPVQVWREESDAVHP